MQPGYQIGAMEPSYHVACLRAVSGFTQTFPKLDDLKGNFRSSTFAARHVNPFFPHAAEEWGEKRGERGKSSGSGKEKRPQEKRMACSVVLADNK